jgi:hypothetical protein
MLGVLKLTSPLRLDWAVGSPNGHPTSVDTEGSHNGITTGKEMESGKCRPSIIIILRFHAVSPIWKDFGP